MEILENSSKIHSKLKELFSKDTRHLRRYILVAYVGEKAENLLDFENVNLYCWPQIGATNPYALAQLKEKGAEIYLVDNLHMKVYWVENRGAIITSANLSRNALKFRGPYEIGIFLEDSKAIKIHSIIKKFGRENVRPLTREELLELQEKHNESKVNQERTPTKSHKRKKGYSYHEKPDEDDFRFGHTNELVNIRALQEGYQICLCQKTREYYDLIFLYKKTTRESKYKKSKNAQQFDFLPINRHVTKYAAEVKGYLEVPGRNREFWEELYEEGEFDLWDIDKGPMKYFESKRWKINYLMILKVFKIPFLLREEKDFIRGGSPGVRLIGGTGEIINDETLKKMQTAFRMGKFEPVLDEVVFEQRLENIEKIAEKHS